jgi:hypothetical protein
LLFCFAVFVIADTTVADNFPWIPDKFHHRAPPPPFASIFNQFASLTGHTIILLHLSLFLSHLHISTANQPSKLAGAPPRASIFSSLHLLSSFHIWLT